jgi:hypothetical protein
MVEQEHHAIVDGARVDEVVVIEHQHDVLRDGAELVEHRREDRFERRRLMRLQQRDGTRADAGFHSLQRGDQVSPEGRWIVVALVEREPRRGASIGRSGRQPLGQQRRLTEPGRRGDER